MVGEMEADKRCHFCIKNLPDGADLQETNYIRKKHVRLTCDRL